MDYRKKIKNSSLIFSINRSAKLIFQQWLKNAKKTYQLQPELIEKIKDDNIQNEVLDTLIDAVETLITEKTTEQKTVKGWSFGFVCGYIQGNLDVAWFNRYVVKLSREYEDFVKIKAISELFRVDDIAVDKVLSIYNYFIDQRISPVETVNTQTSNVVSISNNNIGKRNNFKTEIIELLLNDFEKKYINLLTEKEQLCCPDICEYFNENEFKQILGN